MSLFRLHLSNLTKDLTQFLFKILSSTLSFISLLICITFTTKSYTFAINIKLCEEEKKHL